jgi:hypothetical protein
VKVTDSLSFDQRASSDRVVGHPQRFDVHDERPFCQELWDAASAFVDVRNDAHLGATVAPGGSTTCVKAVAKPSLLALSRSESAGSEST